MYAKVNITETHLNILELFTRGFDKEYYIREVQRLLKISPRTAQLVLDDLEKKTVLESYTKGKIRLYKLRRTVEARDYITFTEIYKRIKFAEKSLKIKEIIDRLSSKIEGMGLIFGSYAKGIEKKDSDLDIFIAGTYDKEEFERVSSVCGVKLDIKNYPLKLFKSELNKDILIKEVLDDHIILSGSECLINMIIKPKF